ncbi:MAG: IS110 family transposase [Phycisphaerae bacterium]|nr:IS110 family transposase [candidate division KSB1 bacterium]NIV00234.1 IS110 family transposase [Phycisphaerae bacterium]NIR68634.1 IS110 family transposase [candidate division KSB1 bacterium]NIT74011.1 IS110 family transposase [candidate division KSB1 bacterium]NIU27877.1 IS110 family transposase [candidate division KSB1 bacterium]
MHYEELFVGIDVSKYKHDVAVMTADEKRLGKTFSIAESAAGFNQLVAKLLHLRERYGTKRFYIGLEATGDYWKNLYHCLRNQSEAWHVTVINPFQTKHFAKSELRRAKTDPVDAQDIARFMAQKRPRATACRNMISDAIKDLDKQIYYYQKLRTMAMSKLRIELAKVAPELEQATRVIAGSQILALLASYPTAEAIALASESELRQVRYSPREYRLPQKFVKELKMLCENSIAYKKGVGSGYVVQSLVRQILECQKEVKLLKTNIKELYLCINESESLLATIHSIGKETAIVLEAYIGDVQRFPSAKQMVAYFGMNPVVSQSGKSRGTSRLEKKGSGLVRHKLFMAVLNMIRTKAEPIYSYYKRLVDAGKPKLVAICACMRKLLVIIYTMLKKQQPFDPKKNENG